MNWRICTYEPRTGKSDLVGEEASVAVDVHLVVAALEADRVAVRRGENNLGQSGALAFTGSSR
jgi:hypothetical protein